MTRRYALPKLNFETRALLYFDVPGTPRKAAEAIPLILKAADLETTSIVCKINGITGLIQLKPLCLIKFPVGISVHNRIVNGSFCGVTSG